MKVASVTLMVCVDMYTFAFPLILLVIFGSKSYGLLALGAKAVPPAECNEDVENPKFYEEACSNDTECFGGPNSMVCKDGKCQCAEDYLPEERFTGEQAVQKVCVPAPNLFTKCNTTCQKPGVCQLYTGEGSDGETKICQCVQPFLFDNGLCYRNCASDEYYEPSKYKCIKRCQENEVRINETCLALADLSGTCQSDLQCQTPFSECRSNVCACKSGFDVENALCVPQTVSCPWGEPLKQSNKFVSCRILEAKAEDSSDEDVQPQTEKALPPTAGGKRANDCPEGNFCLVPSGDFYLRPNSTGFCCPIRASFCPVGSPHLTAKCGAISPGEQSCPWETHFCQMQGSTSEEKSVCCPKSCSSEFVQVDNKCLPRVHLGDACSSKAQCTEAYSDCVGGVCQCQSGAKLTDTPSYRYCSIECADDEVVQSSKCVKRLNLADFCSPKKSFLCPEYARCSSKKQCVCQCGAFTLVDNVCAPPPICRPPTIFPVPLFASERAAAGASGPPPIPRISDEERDKLLQNTTFCKVKGKNPPNGLKIADCSVDQYCSQYITNVGICCPKPEPFCPLGGQPKNGSACDPKNPLSCGLENSCIKYLSAVDQDANSKDYTVCCPKSIFGPRNGFAD